MGPNIYLYHKALEEHYQDLLREAEKERLLAQLPQHRWSMIKRTMGSARFAWSHPASTSTSG